VERRITGVVIHPVTGRGAALFQPERLRGSAAHAFLRRLQLRSVPFRTPIAVTGERGYVAAGDGNGSGPAVRGRR
jgi:hypothetical protein